MKEEGEKKTWSNSGSDCLTRKIRAWIVYPITDLLSVQKEIKARSNEPCAHADRAEDAFQQWATFCGKCSWTEHSPWHLVKEISKVSLLMPLVGNQTKHYQVQGGESRARARACVCRKCRLRFTTANMQISLFSPDVESAALVDDLLFHRRDT